MSRDPERLKAALAAWRARSHDDQAAHFDRVLGAPRPDPDDGRLRVGLLCPCLILGGAEAWQLALGRYTDPEKIRWEGCCVVPDNPRISPAMRSATEGLMPVTVGPAAARELARRCDVLVTWAIDGLPNLVRGLARPPRVVATIHAPAESPWGRTVYARPDGIDRWVAVSELALDALPAESRHVPAGTIWNCVDLDRMKVRRPRFAMRDRWGISRHDPVAVYLGRLSAEKDPHAMARLAAALPDPWRVVVVGDGAERPEPHPRLVMAGPDPAAGEVLNAADVLVVPSHYESFGLTLAEGIASGRPVVATGVGIARLTPGVAHPIPINADGPTLARAVLAAYDSGPAPAARALIPRLMPDRFGAEWTELLCSLARPAPKFDPESFRDRRLLVLGCDYRGEKTDGSCGCAELRICRAGKGRNGTVVPQDCEACVTDWPRAPL